MNIQGLIERYEKFKASKKKMTSVDLVLKDLRTLDEPEPLPFKLKDVVRRIRGFDPTTQTRWLNDILKELGDEYGSMKYREGYEQGKFDGEWVGNQLKDADKIRQELNKPVIPQFVADWIERSKQEKRNLRNALNNGGEKMRLWFLDQENYDLFGRAWLDGYEVEKEKRYKISVKSNKQILIKFKNRLNKWFEFADIKIKEPYYTRKELEEVGFGWVFDCEGVEVEEVEEVE